METTESLTSTVKTIPSESKNNTSTVRAMLSGEVTTSIFLADGADAFVMRSKTSGRNIGVPILAEVIVAFHGDLERGDVDSAG